MFVYISISYICVYVDGERERERERAPFWLKSPHRSLEGDWFRSLNRGASLRAFGGGGKSGSKGGGRQPNRLWGIVKTTPLVCQRPWGLGGGPVSDPFFTTSPVLRGEKVTASEEELVVQRSSSVTAADWGFLVLVHRRLPPSKV